MDDPSRNGSRDHEQHLIPLQELAPLCCEDVVRDDDDARTDNGSGWRLCERTVALAAVTAKGSQLRNGAAYRRRAGSFSCKSAIPTVRVRAKRTRLGELLDWATTCELAIAPPGVRCVAACLSECHIRRC